MVQINKVGQPCKKCHTPVVLQKRRKITAKVKKKRNYYFSHYFKYTNCATIYYHDQFKIYLTDKKEKEVLLPLPKKQHEKNDIDYYDKIMEHDTLITELVERVNELEANQNK